MSEDLYEKLLNAAFRFVSYRPRSEKEIRDFLQKKLKSWKTYAPTMVDRVIARMAEYGHVDDAKFAQWWLTQRANFRPKGSRVLALELKQHGVAREVVETVLAGQKSDLGPYNELEAAHQAIKHKIAIWKAIPSQERQKKVYGFLGRRGFSADTIRRIIDEAAENRYNTEEEKNVFED